jgi:hypothetical protein
MYGLVRALMFRLDGNRQSGKSSAGSEINDRAGSFWNKR